MNSSILHMATVVQKPILVRIMRGRYSVCQTRTAYEGRFLALIMAIEATDVVDTSYLPERETSEIWSYYEDLGF